MRSIALVVIICSTLLHTVPISTVPISIDEMGSAEPKTPSPDTEPAMETLITTEHTQTDPSVATEEPATTTKEPTATHPPSTTTEEPKATDPPATTTEEPKATDPPTTSTPPVLCKDLEMDDSGTYGPQMGSIPKPPANNERVVPINAIKLPRKSCKELHEDGYDKSGLYIIKPGKVEVTVFCDMTLLGGGWTVIQRRLNIDKTLSNRSYADYQRGFGDLSSSFWSGLDTIHSLTSDGAELFIGLQYVTIGVPAFYRSFSVGDATTGYELSVSGHDNSMWHFPEKTGTTIYSARDSLTGRPTHNGQKFSAFDKDQDQNDKVKAGNCAKTHKGGWWYNNCLFADLNGDKIIWRNFLGWTSFQHSIMAVR